MSGIVSFGAYIFPNVKQFRTNFGNGLPVTTKLPFAHGVWVETGQAALPSEQGMVEVSFTLNAETDLPLMDSLRDGGMGLRMMGMQKLIYQPSDPETAERYTFGVVNDIQMSQRKDGTTDIFQPITVRFLAPDSFWYGGEYEGALAGDDDLVADDDLYWGEGALVIPCTGLETLATVTNNGNAPAVCAYTVSPPTSETCQNPTIERLVDSVVMDQVIYNGILTDADSFEVDGHAHTLNLNGLNTFADCVWQHPNLLRLMPGENTVRIKLTNAGDEAVIHLFFSDTWS